MVRARSEAALESARAAVAAMVAGFAEAAKARVHSRNQAAGSGAFSVGAIVRAWRPAMTYKTIVAIIQNEATSSGLLEAVVPLASRLGSHLIGIHAEPLPVPMTIGMGFPDAEFVITTGEINRKRAAELEALFKKRGSARPGCPFEWRAVESFSGDSAVAARAGARTADLVVASEADADELRPSADLDALLYETGRPVLLVPLVGPEAKVRSARCWSPGTAPPKRRAPPSTRCPSSWRPTRPASSPSTPATNPRSRRSRLAAALARHGAHVSVNELSSGGRPVADVIAEQVTCPAPTFW